VATFLSETGNWRILADLVGLAIGGGLFTVPLYAILQHESEPSHRARVIAANNIINALAMTVAAVVAAALLARGITMGELLGLCGLATIPVIRLRRDRPAPSRRASSASSYGSHRVRSKDDIRAVPPTP
jgi:MFS family permease